MPAPSTFLSRGMILTASGWSTPPCCKTSWQEATTVLSRPRYLTFGIDADSLKAAKPRLERIETDILNNFKTPGRGPPRPWTARRGWHSFTAFSTWMNRCRSALNGTGWLRPVCPPRISSRRPASSSAPANSSVWVKNTGAVSFLQILAPELNDRMLADFLDMESSLIVSLHIQSVDQIKAIKTVKRRKSPTWINPKLRNRKKPSAPDMTWTSFPPTLPPTVPRPRSSCRICRAETSECSL